MQKSPDLGAFSIYFRTFNSYNNFCVMTKQQFTFRRIFFAVYLYLIAFSIQSQTYNFTAISVEAGLSQSQVNCIMEDSRGFLWIGTAGGGINQYDGNKFKVYEEKDGLAGNIFNSI